ncbi:DUF945 family protein [Necropsobacter rosorum]|uniref:DUF945 family protein n=1 Tax=Necropsobacter rosorum TaxID=908285 RepID=UPI003C7D9CA4
MRKSSIALGVIVALGALWTGGAWYTGKTAEAQYQYQLNKSNERLATLSLGGEMSAQLENVKFERGLFSSAVSYDAVIRSTKENKSYVIPFAGKVYHGPLTINDFSVAMFSAEVAMVKNQQTENWFKDNQSNPLKSTFMMTYDQRLKGTAYSDVSGELNNGRLEWSLSADFDTDKDGYGKTRVTIPSAKITLDALPHETASERDGLQSGVLTAVNSHIELGRTPDEALKALLPGSYYLKSEDLRLDGKNHAGQTISTAFKNAELGLAIKAEQGFADAAVMYKAEDIAHNGLSFGGADMIMQFNHLDVQALNTLTDEMDKQQGDNLTLTPLADDALKVILNRSPQIKITPFAFFNPKGKLSAQFNLVLTKDVEQRVREQKTVLGLFNELGLDIELDKAALSEYLTLIEQANSPTLGREAAAALADSQMQELLRQARQANLFNETDEQLSLHLLLDNHQLNFNGAPLSDQEVQMALFAAMMMFGR